MPAEAPAPKKTPPTTPAPPRRSRPRARSTPVVDAETRIILENVSWQLYEHLLAEHPDRPSPRFAYSDGFLEIMTTGWAHENPNRVLALLVDLVAAEWNLESSPAGQVTCKRKDLEKGFEPDSCFYFGANAKQIRRRKKLVLPRDPPPDLVIEIDITHSSLPRQPLFAAVGVPEVWRYDGRSVRILHLQAGRYTEAPASLALVPLTGKIASRFLRGRSTLPSPLWTRHVREWAQAQLASGARVS